MSFLRDRVTECWMWLRRTKFSDLQNFVLTFLLFFCKMQHIPLVPCSNDRPIKRNLNKWVGKNNESTCFFTGQWMAWGKWCESLMCCSQNSTLLNRQRSSSPSSKHLEHLWQGALKHRLKLFALICHSSVSVTTACHVMSTGFCTQPMINRSEMTLCMMRIWVPMKM